VLAAEVPQQLRHAFRLQDFCNHAAVHGQSSTSLPVCLHVQLLCFFFGCSFGILSLLLLLLLLLLCLVTLLLFALCWVGLQERRSKCSSGSNARLSTACL
jgi:hypothetical protein